MTFTANLTWGTHIEYVYDKANKRLHALRLLKKAGVRENDLVRIYCALIRSVLEYVSPVWSSLHDYLSNHIKSIQKRALRIIVGAYHMNYQQALIRSRLSSKKLDLIRLSHFILLSVKLTILRLNMVIISDQDLLIHIGMYLTLSVFLNL